MKRWLDRGWPIGLALFVFILHLVYLWPGGPALRHTGLMLVFDHDEATVFYDAFRVALGEVPYRDFFNFKGPVFGLVHGLGFVIGGHHWEVGQLLWIVYDATAMGFLAALVVRLSGRGVAFFVVCFHACIVILVWPRPYEQWLAQASIVAAIWLFAHTEAEQRARLFTVGVLLGLASMTALSMGAPVAVTAIALVFLRGFELSPVHLRSALRAAATTSVGVVGGVAFALLPSALQGALGAMYEQTILWPRRSYVGSQPSVYGEGRAAIASKLAELEGFAARLVGEASLGLVYLLPILLAVLVGLAAIAFAGSPRLGSVRRHPVFSIVMLSGAGAAHLLLRGINRDITHLGFVGLYALLALGASLSLFTVARPRIARVISWVASALGLAVLGFYLFALAKTWDGSRALGTWREASLAAFPYPELLPTLDVDATIVYGSYAPGYVYFHVRPAATPITNFPLQPRRWVGYYDQAQYRWLADRVFAERPAVMAISGEQWNWLETLEPRFRAAYQRVPNSQRGFVELYTRTSTLP